MIDFHSSLRHSKSASPPFADYTFDLLWIALFVMCESLCCWLHFVVLMQLINAKGANSKTAPWQKHKSKKTARHDGNLTLTLMGHNKSKTAMSCCGSRRDSASESVRDDLRWHYTHQAQWQLSWIGFVSFFPSHNSFCLHSHCVVSVGYWLVFVL